MLDKIYIRNFKSLENVSLELQDVNLLIGANNSGKTNLLKALVFFSRWLKTDFRLNENGFKRLVFGQKEIVSENEAIALTFRKKMDDKEFIYCAEIYKIHNDLYSYNQFVGIAKNEVKRHFTITNLNYIDENFPEFILQIEENSFYKNKPYDKFQEIEEKNYNDFIMYRLEDSEVKIEANPSSYQKNFLERHSNRYFSGFITELLETFSTLKIYQPAPSKFSKPYPTLAKDYTVQEDAANLVSFLDNMRDEYPEVIKAIVDDLHYSVEEFVDLRFQKVDITQDSEAFKLYGDKTFKKFGLFDKYGRTYWAEELSEGTLYFLALLAIIHQPNPPKLLLLEEPEKGIHPRRIKDVLEYIFLLSSKKNIQVIMTTHSPEVLNFFREMPENVFIVDKKEDATEIKNLYKDIIEPTEKKAEANGLDMDLTDDLADNWKSGFFGGVPFNH
ncbi:MAG: AAA family ATPase [Microscillaceae bacterium]|nr:AAA family ATPase [Microscillaceae bacterium]